VSFTVAMQRSASTHTPATLSPSAQSFTVHASGIFTTFPATAALSGAFQKVATFSPSPSKLTFMLFPPYQKF